MTTKARGSKKQPAIDAEFRVLSERIVPLPHPKRAPATANAGKQIEVRVMCLICGTRPSDSSALVGGQRIPICGTCAATGQAVGEAIKVGTEAYKLIKKWSK